MSGFSEHGFRQQLNNYMQHKYGNALRIEWTIDNEGLQHVPKWVATATFQQVEIGRGYGSSKGEAFEQASERALAYLRR